MGRPSRWQRFVDSAVRSDAPEPRQATAGSPGRLPAGTEVHSAGVRGIVPRTAGGLPALLAARLFPALADSTQAAAKHAASGIVDRPRRRTDLRLALPALLAWAAAV